MKKITGFIMMLALVLTVVYAAQDAGIGISVNNITATSVPEFRFASTLNSVNIDDCMNGNKQLSDSDVMDTLSKKKDWKDGDVVGVSVNKFLSYRDQSIANNYGVACGRKVVLWQHIGKFTPFSKASTWIKTITLDTNRFEHHQTWAGGEDHASTILRSAQTKFYDNVDGAIVYRVMLNNTSIYVLTLESQSNDLNLVMANFDDMTLIQKKVLSNKII